MSVSEPLKDRFRSAINSLNQEAFSNTPDFILAEFLGKCLEAGERMINERSRWYGVHDVPGQIHRTPSQIYDDGEHRRSEVRQNMERAVKARGEMQEILKTREFTYPERQTHENLNQIIWNWQKELIPGFEEQKAKEIDAIRQRFEYLEDLGENRNSTQEMQYKEMLYNWSLLPVYERSKVKNAYVDSEDFDNMNHGREDAEATKIGRKAMEQIKMEDVDAATKEGSLFISAMSFLTTDLWPSETYYSAFNKVKNHALQMSGESKPQPIPRNAGNRNEVEP